MSVLTIIKKIGDEVIGVVEWPFKHAVMLAHLMRDVPADAQATRDVLVGLVNRFEAIGVDVGEAIGFKGLNPKEDLDVMNDLKSLLDYFNTTVKPTIEKDFADLKTDTKVASVDPAPADPVVIDPAATSDAPQKGPGLSNVTAA